MTRHAHGGFALVMVLLLLLMVVAVMGMLCRASALQAVTAQQAEVQLQRKWGRRFAQQAWVAGSLQAFGKSKETGQVETGNTLHWRMPIRDGVMHVLMSNEQAKVNVNQLKRLFPQQAEKLAEQLQLQTKGMRLSLLPRWSQRQSIISYSQLFENGELPETLVAIDQAQVSPRLTCWGNGKLDVGHADREALTAWCGDLLVPDEIESLLRYRMENPRIGKQRLLTLVTDNAKIRQQLSQRMTDHVRCVSIWLIYQTPHCRWYRLVVVEQDAAGLTQVRVFQW